jgi:hypothetical protein
MADFGAAVGQAYASEGAALDLGRGVHEGALAPRRSSGCRWRR